MSEFSLHPTLAADTRRVAALPLSELLLMNDARFPWAILVPRVPGLTELHQLSREHRGLLMDELERTSTALLALPEVSKINVGALGNRVAQLHVHVVGRDPADPVWPDPVWGSGPAVPYAEAAAERLLRHLEMRAG
jgi:diadenosine tetraphosphate (Ap4A) HIT family hydrolase